MKCEDNFDKEMFTNSLSSSSDKMPISELAACIQEIIMVFLNHQINSSYQNFQTLSKNMPLVLREIYRMLLVR